MIDRKIVYTKDTPKNSKKYLLDFLNDQKIEYKRYVKGKKEWVIIRSDKPETRHFRERIEGFLFYCSMIEEPVEMKE